jgi:hypothetical protein
MRFPGTGTGVALLVEVSMVKVDMERPFSRAAVPQPTPLEPQLADNRAR